MLFLKKKKKTDFNNDYLIEVGPKRWSKQALFILLNQETIDLQRIDRTKKL